MYISFDLLPPHSRIWIYQADRKISYSEKDIISSALTSFTQQWQVHGNPMKTSFKLYFDQFIILAADEGYNAASGCSIDGSVRALKSIGEQYNIDFFNRNLVAFKKSNEIELIPMADLKRAHEKGLWNDQTPTFNNLINKIEQIETQWIVPSRETWLNRYLPFEMVNTK